MKKIIVLLCIAFLSVHSYSQEVEIPENIVLKTKADYEKNEPLVLKAIDWIQNTPVSQDKNKREIVSAFLLRWMTGTPNVSIAISADIAPLNSPECLIVFMGGWTKYSLENKYSKDKLACNLAAIESVIEFYEKNKAELGKDADIKKMIKRKKKGKLKKYIESKV